MTDCELCKDSVPVKDGVHFWTAQDGETSHVRCLAASINYCPYCFHGAIPEKGMHFVGKVIGPVRCLAIPEDKQDEVKGQSNDCGESEGSKAPSELSPVNELRKACLCLYLELPASIADDVKAKAEAVIALAAPQVVTPTEVPWEMESGESERAVRDLDAEQERRAVWDEAIQIAKRHSRIGAMELAHGKSDREWDAAVTSDPTIADLIVSELESAKDAIPAPSCDTIGEPPKS